MGFSKQEYWSGLPFPSPWTLSDPGIKPISPALAGRFITTAPPGKTPKKYDLSLKILKSSGIPKKQPRVFQEGQEGIKFSSKKQPKNLYLKNVERVSRH